MVVYTSKESSSSNECLQRERKTAFLVLVFDDRRDFKEKTAFLGMGQAFQVHNATKR